MEPPGPSHAAQPTLSDAKWARWNGVLESANDLPSKRTLARQIAVPMVVAVVVCVVLIVLNPPFICTDKGKVSATRTLIWSAIAGGITALLTAQGVFARFAKTC